MTAGISPLAAGAAPELGGPGQVAPQGSGSWFESSRGATTRDDERAGAQEVTMSKQRDAMHEMRRRAAWLRQRIHERASVGQPAPAHERELAALDLAIPELAFLWKIDLSKPSDNASEPAPEGWDEGGKAVGS